MHTRTMAAAVSGLLIATAFSSASYADGTPVGMPMMDDPMNLRASGATGGDPPRYHGSFTGQSNGNTNNIYRDRAGYGLRRHNGGGQRKMIRRNSK